MAKIKTAVISGMHGYDVVGFQTMFRQMPEIDFYPQHLEDFAGDRGQGRQDYEVVVCYHNHRFTPGIDQDKLAQKVKGPLEEIVTRGQGILVLHHALLAFPQWQFWSDLCGIQDRRYSVELNQNLSIQINNPYHMITQGLAPWEMVDEAYRMVDANVGSDILLTTAHPKSMWTIAWAREFHGTRVFCCQSGHDNLVYSNPQFRTVIERAIQWLAKRPVAGTK